MTCFMTTFFFFLLIKNNIVERRESGGEHYARINDKVVQINLNFTLVILIEQN